MKKYKQIKIVRKLLVLSILLVLTLAEVSAFCNSQGYILDSDGNFVEGSRVNIICHRINGNLTYTQLNTSAYGFPFGDWYDDCTYCDQGIEIMVFEDNNNLYGGYFNESCVAEIDTCHSNIYMNQVSEIVSIMEGYSITPDLGPLAEKQIKMPRSNASAEEKLSSVREDLSTNYTSLYIIGGIILLIVVILWIRKYGK